MVKSKDKKTKPVSKKTPAPCPLGSKPEKKVIKKEKKGIKINPLIFQKKKRSHAIGVGIRPKRDLTRFVRWPKHVRIQRKKKILMQRLRVPPCINQFNHTLDASQTKDLFDFLMTYKPETKKEKHARLLKEAQNKSGTKASKKPVFLKCGIKHVTKLVEKKKAKLVIIANDVCPIELVMFLPTVCRMKEIPYCIVKNKKLLGKLVNKKFATAVCLDNVRPEDRQKLEHYSVIFKDAFNDNAEIRRKWGGNILSPKSLHVLKLRDRAQKLEESKKKNFSAKI